MDPFRLRIRVATLRIAKVRVAAVDDRVAGIAEREQLLERVLGDLARRDHQPEGPRRGELIAELAERGRGGLDTRVVRLDVVPVLAETDRHVAAHPSQPDHSQLHWCPFRRWSRVSGDSTRSPGKD